MVAACLLCVIPPLLTPVTLITGVTVASGCTIDYVAPGYEGDTLIAISKERTRSGRTGVYDITLTNQNGDELAFFRGKAYQIKGSVIPE